MSPELERNPRIAGRYPLLSELGRGGMAVVYRVHDPARQCDVALKQLLIKQDAVLYAESCARFEREFHTLSELSHPRVIEVYDYGIDLAGPFYTMELLDGADLTSQAPLPWLRACRLIHDVCSSLALLHSRRLVHCDVSPRNVHCTSDGRAKLIDFGAMAPFGRGPLIVGTPAFTAPEVVARSELDGRTDLFSLGATLYYALTGRSAFAAREFADLLDAWGVKPRPPSHFAREAPEVLDRLVLSLLSLDASERPRNTFEVMQRLAAIAGIDQSETIHVAEAYLSSPLLIGREPISQAIGEQLERAFAGQGRAVLIRGRAGLGRSRMLDATIIAAKLRGAGVLRAGADAARAGDFGVAQRLCEQLVESLSEPAIASARREGVFEQLFEEPTSGQPRLIDLTNPSRPRPQLQAALSRWFLALGRSHPLAIAVDDLERIDEPSAGLLAQCAAQSDGRRLCLVLALQTEGELPLSRPVEVLAQKARGFELTPLTEAETTLLMTSVFGDVPNVAVVGHGVHAVAGGNPRLCLDLARHLVDSGCVHYADGSWTLPNRLGSGDLPESADSALRARVAALGPLARQLLESQALASHEAFTREDYALLSNDASAQQIDLALLELIGRELLVGDGRAHWLKHRSWVGALIAHMSEADKRVRHAAIAESYGNSLKGVFHWFAAEQLERGLDVLFSQFRALGDAIDVFATLHITAWELGRLFERALAAAYQLGRSPRDIFDLLRWLAQFAVASEDAYYWQAAPRWLEQLRKDSGLDDWDRFAHVTDHGARLTAALQAAFERYTNAPEPERVSPPDQAIRQVVHYVVISIAIGSRTCDVRLVESLPALLEPFVPLSPAVAAMHQNACATREMRCYVQPERARKRWIELYERLDKLSEAELPYLRLIQNAIASGIASAEAQLGLRSADEWANRVQTDPLQAVQAHYMHKIVALQQGDWAAADRHRKQAELLALQSHVRPMFSAALMIELAAHSSASDLTGVKQVKDRIDQLAAQCPHWRAAQLLADGWYKQLCGQLEEASARFDACIKACEPDPADPSRVIGVWPSAVAAQIETLIELGQPERAREIGVVVLEHCRNRGIEASAQPIERALALAEAKLGEFDAAARRLERLIERQLADGVTGLLLGASYEARARVAIWAGDEQGLTEFGRLTAGQYRHGQGSPLGARYERLMDEARVTFPHRFAEFAAFDLASAGGTHTQRHATAAKVVSQVLRQATTRDERAAFALSLLCEERGASGGQLFLVEERGLRLAATQGHVDGDLDLEEQAERWLAEQFDNSELATRFESELQPVDLKRPLTPRPSPQAEPLGLSCACDGQVQYVGVAMLVLGGATGRVRSDLRLSTAIASQLLEAGDTRAYSGR